MRVTSSASSRASVGRMPGKSPGEHRLPGSRRAHQQEVVRAGCGDLERASGALLAAQVGEIRNRAVLDRALVDRLEGGRSRCVRGSTRRPRRDAERRRARFRRAPPPAPTRQRTRDVAVPRGALPRQPRASRRRDGCVPSSASSPTAACSASRSGGSCLVAPRTASEIGRSNPDPSFRSAAGARFTVMRRLSGHSSAADTTPLRTRCFASWQARSARPTIAKPGMPGWRCASTSTFRGSRPTSAWVTARASTAPRCREDGHGW